jgi:hypothetical protein
MVYLEMNRPIEALESFIRGFYEHGMVNQFVRPHQGLYRLIGGTLKTLGVSKVTERRRAIISILKQSGAASRWRSPAQVRAA